MGKLSIAKKVILVCTKKKVIGRIGKMHTSNHQICMSSGVHQRVFVV